MKKSKLLAALMLAGLCGVSEADAKSHKSEIKNLERQKAQYEAEHRESKERLRELTYRAVRKADEDEPDDWRTDAFSDDEGELVRNEEASKGPAGDRQNPDLVKQRETEAARVKAAEKEMAKIDKAIRREKARERQERELSYHDPR